MASMVNRPLLSQPLYNRRHVAILSINKIHGEFRSSCTCLQLLYGLHHTAHRLPCTRWAGLIGRRLLEFK